MTESEIQNDIQALEDLLPHLTAAILAARRLQGHCETCGIVKQMSPVGMASTLDDLGDQLVGVRVLLRTGIFTETRPTGSNIRLFFPKPKDASG